MYLFTKRDAQGNIIKVPVDEVPKTPDECPYCLGELHLNNGEVLHECEFKDRECPTWRRTPMVCCLSLHGYCNQLVEKEN